ncbi:uncharacterized [Tachysurus ichikawai]
MYNALQADPLVLKGITVGTQKARHRPALYRRALLCLKSVFGGVLEGYRSGGLWIRKYEQDLCLACLPFFLPEGVRGVENREWLEPVPERRRGSVMNHFTMVVYVKNEGGEKGYRKRKPNFVA